ncbi:hypothetical protein B0H19DRAFT_1056631 [Mycena capillaripes]|nr:hypothetical protein B0H19DRAFT_1056631 [Mycena capillaripes]
MHQNQIFPILVSLSIVLVDIERNPNVTSILSAFTNAPSLRSLTDLELDLPIGLGEVRAILTRCRKLQAARFPGCTGPEDIEAPEIIIQLDDLQALDLGIDDARSNLFFQAFSFPNLGDLVIHRDTWVPEIQWSLYDRSQFQLESLVLGVYYLDSHCLFDFLGLLPTLRELKLYFCGIDHELFEAFTFGSSPSLRPPRLPLLETLHLSQHTQHFTPTSVVSMAESLCLNRGRPNTLFPTLKSVCLDFYGAKFEDDIQRRLTAAYNVLLTWYNWPTILPNDSSIHAYMCTHLDI